MWPVTTASTACTILMPIPAASFASLPDDIKLQILAHLDSVTDVCSLCLVCPTWVEPCRSRLFKRLETTRRKNPNLLNLVELVTSKAIGPNIRRLDLSFAYKTVKGPGPSAIELDDWLVARDDAFKLLVQAATGLRIARVRFNYDSPYTDSTSKPHVSRASLAQVYSS